MSELREDLKYTKTHEWIKIKNGTIRMGVTPFALGQMKDLAALEWEKSIEDEVSAGDEIILLDVAKSIQYLYAPVSGKIVALNTKVLDTEDVDDYNIDLLMDDPYGEGWIADIEIVDSSELENLLSPEEYDEETKKESK